MTAAPHSLLRGRGNDASGRVGMVELFFDLVFVFAITQLSHRLLAHLDPLGALQTAVLLVAVWWVWMYTSWVTNWLDPERMPVRLCLFALMLAGLLLSSSIPKAFGIHGGAFVGAYLAMHVGRTLFTLWAMRGETLARRRNFQRILAWMLLAAVFWGLGAFAPAQPRLGWWTLALAIELLAPLTFFWTPGLSRSSSADWDVDGHHMAERCGLFVIIALGESLLVTGATFAELDWSASTGAALLVSFVGSVAMWWVYFDTGATRATHRFAHSDDPGRIARMAYTYLHLPIVAGIIVCAVADELLLVHPGHAAAAAVATVLGGPALYLFGNAAFKWSTNDRRTPPLSHSAGLLLLGALALSVGSLHPSALLLGTLATAVLVLVAGWESVALRRVDPSR